MGTSLANRVCVCAGWLHPLACRPRCVCAGWLHPLACHPRCVCPKGLTFVEEGDVVVLHGAQVHILLEVHLLSGVGGQQTLPVETLLWRSDEAPRRAQSARTERSQEVRDHERYEITRGTRSREVRDHERYKITRSEEIRDQKRYEIRRDTRSEEVPNQERRDQKRYKIRRDTRSEEIRDQRRVGIMRDTRL